MFNCCYFFHQDWEQRQEEDNLLIERILLLVRNILHVPADPCEEKVCYVAKQGSTNFYDVSFNQILLTFTFCFLSLQKVDDDASIHDKVLWAIHMSGFDDLVKFLASAQSEQQWSMHVLEIISLMFRDQVWQMSLLAVSSVFLHFNVFLYFPDGGAPGKRRPFPFSRREAERSSGTGGAAAEGERRETFEDVTERNQVKAWSNVRTK